MKNRPVLDESAPMTQGMAWTGQKFIFEKLLLTHAWIAAIQDVLSEDNPLLGNKIRRRHQKIVKSRRFQKLLQNLRNTPLQDTEDLLRNFEGTVQ